MDIKQQIGIDIKFEDVPDECKVYTYLYSQAIILYYNDNKCTIWDEHSIVRLVHPIYLNADKEELQKCNELFARYVQNIKSEQPVGIPKYIYGNGTGQWHSFLNSDEDDDGEIDGIF